MNVPFRRLYVGMVHRSLHKMDVSRDPVEPGTKRVAHIVPPLPELQGFPRPPDHMDVEGIPCSPCPAVVGRLGGKGEHGLGVITLLLTDEGLHGTGQRDGVLLPPRTL